MAVNIVLCNRSDKTSSRLNVPDISLNSKVSEFRVKAARLTDVPLHEIELVYCGQCLKDGRSLESYGLRSGSTIHLLKKHESDQQQLNPEPMDSGSVQQVVTALQAALLNPAHRHTVETMMTKPETLENLIAATPGLDRDPIALAILQNAELLAIMADPDQIHKVIEAHPCLGHAAMMVAAAINEESVYSGSSRSTGPSRAAYNLDQMSDDEDMPGPSASRHTPAQPITATQLAAALMVAGGGGGGGSQTAAPSNQEAAPTTGGITQGFLQQAMMGLSNQSSTPARDQATPLSPDVMQASLQQLRDMGITDEGRARRALEITAGNIQAALELLFGDNDL